MGALILGVAVLALALIAAQAFVKANPRQLAGRVRTIGGGLAMAAGAALLFTGRGGLGLPLIVVGFSLLMGRGIPGFGGMAGGVGRARRPTGGQTSRVRSAAIEMELDHDTGDMRGRVLAGPHQGQTLDGLGDQDLFGLWKSLVSDGESQALLEAYLDRRTPGWREDLEGHAQSRAAGTGGAGPMTEQEAYQILGLDAGAGAEEVRRAHRTLMKKLHPDQGGSTYLAARVNEAKEILLRRHG